MAQMQLPAEPTYRRTSYSKLLGADFSVDPSLVDSRHSPDLLNMISDNGGNPIKRPGWEVMFKGDGETKVTNIWSFFEEEKRYIAATYDGEEDYILQVYDENGSAIGFDNGGDTQTELTLTTGGKHIAFYTEINDDIFGFYVMDGTTYHRFFVENDTLKYEEVEPHVPLVLISRDPTGGGTAYEDINLLTRARKEQFLNSGTNKNFVVSGEVDTTKPWTIRYADAQGEWAVAGTSDDPGGCSVSGSTFTTASVYTPVQAGVDNIQIEYYATGDSKAGQVLGCTVNARFSGTAQDQIFVSGNKDRKNYVYYSSPNDVTYWPDLNYMNIGGETAVVGFLNLGEYLAIVKESTAYDSTVFMVYQTSYSSKSVSITDGNRTTSETTQVHTFAVKRATAGTGAISNHAFAVLNDEPLFLSPSGVVGVVSTNLTSEKIVRNRSYFVDKKLLSEGDLENAVATVWNNYYVCVINGHAYILDGRHKTSDYNGNTNYRYEAYYWENIPATCIVSYGKELWFGTGDGRICRFKNSGEPTDYSDGTDHSDATVTGTAIVATWSTPNDNDGQTEYYKKMMKKGTMCTVAPFDESSVKVYIRADSYPRQYLGMWYVDISDMFNQVKFDRLSFDSRRGPRDEFFRKKQKKYQRLQIILENDQLNEPFGIFEIVKTYVYQRYAKGPAPIKE